jgi:hypothetical protein
MRVKGLDFEGGAVGLREQSDTTVRHRAVYVHKKKFDLRRAFPEGRRDFDKTSQRSLQENTLRDEDHSGV